MELLLNLAWMLLAVPAYWLWQRRRRSPGQDKANAVGCLLALACVLVLLFPVISASDDLHAMRTEIEDSSSGKRAVWHAGSDRASAWVNRLQGSAGLLASTWLPAMEVLRFEGCSQCVSPVSGPGSFGAGRAPPFSLAR